LKLRRHSDGCHSRVIPTTQEEESPTIIDRTPFCQRGRLMPGRSLSRAFFGMTLGCAGGGIEFGVKSYGLSVVNICNLQSLICNLQLLISNHQSKSAWNKTQIPSTKFQTCPSGRRVNSNIENKKNSKLRRSLKLCRHSDGCHSRVIPTTIFSPSFRRRRRRNPLLLTTELPFVKGAGWYPGDSSVVPPSG